MNARRAPLKGDTKKKGTNYMNNESREIINLPKPSTEETCELCLGLGWIGDGPPWDSEPEHIDCPDCGGSGKVKRNALREAFLIVQGRTMMLAERKHLIAVVEYCRQLTTAALELPQPKPPASSIQIDKEQVA